MLGIAIRRCPELTAGKDAVSVAISVSIVVVGSFISLSPQDITNVNQVDGAVYLGISI